MPATKGHLVYIDGFGVHIHPLFARRHNIEWGADIDRSVMERHSKEVPPTALDTAHIWRDEANFQTVCNAAGYEKFVKGR